jgi:Protein of unknown function (DUF2924)
MVDIDLTPDASAPAARAGEGTAPLVDQLAALTRLDRTGLYAAWRRLHRSHPPKKLSRDLLELAIAWKLQERALGGLNAVTRRQLDELARTLASGSNPARARKVRPRPGARIIRHWGGETHEVMVVENGFLWRDRTWNSLSVIAREITGARWSGPRFFGLDNAKPEAAGANHATGESTDA